ncbi:hypothetical protein ETU08_11090 [Apibacter muscae]|uniref:Uncharacterized protein n=1 Tax=Apibacter muscae TaxID=2509004 RepID=A0A563D9Q2_9FLAO|nr:hypothetical protein [Apibacter muscae]TWP26673.1 hypothetical protein ETU09_08905 [Apibacter muscae]TWP28247.1 hypothetical protein ETU08_11090 [Apibacter muscae]
MDRAKIDFVKTEIYKALLLSDEVKKEKEFHLVSIQTLDLDINPNSNFFQIFIKEKKDSISVDKLNQKMPYNYKIYKELKEEKFMDSNLQRVNLYQAFSEYNEWKPVNYSYIRIYEPLDKWANLYLYISDLIGGNPYEIIPVFYTQIKNKQELKQEYKLYKIVYSKQGKIESINTIN